MASLIENLIYVLGKENEEYKGLIELSRQKTPVLIAGDLKRLEQITDEEQIIVDRINLLEKERIEVMMDMSNVLNKDVEKLKLTNLISMLDKSPKEQKQLREVHDQLKTTMADMQQINSHNQDLIRESLELVEFNMNVVRSMKAAPETANYTRYAETSGIRMGTPPGVFDAKQ